MSALASPIQIRPLLTTDLARLPEIHPTYQADTVLRVRNNGKPDPTGTVGRYSWQLIEQPVDPPYSRSAGYDFFPGVLAEIGARLTQDQTCRVLIAEDVIHHRLVGVLDMEYVSWNASLVIWRLMLDQDYRRQGLGKALWDRAVAFASDQGARAINVETQNTNVPACRFYEKMGCVLSGLHTNYYDPATFATREPEIALFWSYSLI